LGCIPRKKGPEINMVGIVLVSHGEMAGAMLGAARMIVGENEHMLAVGLHEADDVEGLMARIASAVDQLDKGDGTLILVDAFGASPFNASARLAMQRGKIEVVTGMNLPMLLELAIQPDDQDLQALTQVALSAGTSSIRTLSDTLS
jgi:mannose PTS system EIIA component